MCRLTDSSVIVSVLINHGDADADAGLVGGARADIDADGVTFAVGEGVGAFQPNSKNFLHFQTLYVISAHNGVGGLVGRCMLGMYVISTHNGVLVGVAGLGLDLRLVTGPVAGVSCARM